MVMAPGRHMVDKLDGANLNNSMASQWIEPSGFGIQHHFTDHDVSLFSARAANTEKYTLDRVRWGGRY